MTSSSRTDYRLSTPTRNALAGFREGFPIFLALFPVGASFGTMAVQIGIPAWVATAMSFFVFAGGAQFMALGMLAAGAGGAEIIVATLVVNLRNFVSGLAILNRIPGLSTRVKVALAHAITDESCALVGVRDNADGALDSPAFVAGLMYAVVAAWVLGTAAGASAAHLFPEAVTKVMGVGIITMFICLLVPRLREAPRYGVITATAAGINLALRGVLGGGWALVTAAVVAAALMIVLEKEGEEA